MPNGLVWSSQLDSKDESFNCSTVNHLKTVKLNDNKRNSRSVSDVSESWFGKNWRKTFKGMSNRNMNWTMIQSARILNILALTVLIPHSFQIVRIFKEALSLLSFQSRKKTGASLIFRFEFESCGLSTPTLPNTFNLKIFLHEYRLASIRNVVRRIHGRLSGLSFCEFKFQIEPVDRLPSASFSLSLSLPPCSAVFYARPDETPLKFVRTCDGHLEAVWEKLTLWRVTSVRERADDFLTKERITGRRFGGPRSRGETSSPIVEVSRWPFSPSLVRSTLSLTERRSVDHREILTCKECFARCRGPARDDDAAAAAAGWLVLVPLVLPTRNANLRKPSSSSCRSSLTLGCAVVSRRFVSGSDVDSPDISSKQREARPCAKPSSDV